MNSKLLYLIIPLAMLMVGSGISSRHLIASTLIDHSGFEEIKKHVYISPNANNKEKQALLKLLKQARSRVIKKFGSYTATPIIISSNDPKLLKKYSGNVFGSTHFSLKNAYIVIGGKGLNLDVISHELVHAEVFKRMGYFKRLFTIPVWFDEGIAMQVDFREKYNAAYNPNYDLFQKKYAWQFFAGDSKHIVANYSQAKAELESWISKRGNGAFYDLLDTIKGGGSFETSYAD